MRRGLAESVRWEEASRAAPAVQHHVRTLFSGANLRALVWTATIYNFWNLAAGTAGIFTPYFIRTLHAGSQVASVGLACAGFIVSMLVTLAVFMPLADRDRRTRKLLWGIGAVMMIVAYGLFLVLPFTVPVIIMNIVLFAGGCALAGDAFYKVFSQELFPTMLRSTAQGFTFGLARIVLGVWSLFVPVLARAGIKEVAGLLVLFLLISGVVGYVFMPDTSGRSLEQLEVERGSNGRRAAAIDSGQGDLKGRS
jgi:inositol transporter-like SP family MFS transporter